jgi:hypothetical protein
MRTQVFTHKGYIGIMSDVKAEGLINNPSQPGQLGFVVDASFVDIQPEALEILKQIKKGRDSLGDIDVFQAGDKVVFSWLGGQLNLLDPKRVSGSRDYNPSTLKSNSEVKPPQDFIDAVDNILKQD